MLCGVQYLCSGCCFSSSTLLLAVWITLEPAENFSFTKTDVCGYSIWLLYIQHYFFSISCDHYPFVMCWKHNPLMKTQKLEWSFVCWFLHAIGVWSTYGACIIYRENHHSVPPSDGFVLSSVCIIAFYNQTAEYKFLSWCNILTESHSYNWLSLWSKQ